MMSNYSKCCLSNIILIVLLFFFLIYKIGIYEMTSALEGFIGIIAVNIGLWLHFAHKK